MQQETGKRFCLFIKKLERFLFVYYYHLFIEQETGTQERVSVRGGS